jgi:hypothetical protein
MIALPHRLPHVLWHNHRLVPLSEGWLAESIDCAAGNAGYPHWHLASHVAKAVAMYLEEECQATVISVDLVEDVIRRSLAGVGFNEMAAAHAKLLPPRVSISLPELASRAPLELAFFPMLGRRLSDALAYEVRGIRLEGLRDCVKCLDAAIKWRQTCQTLSDQIIRFARAYVEQAPSAVELVIC